VSTRVARRQVRAVSPRGTDQTMFAK
jgi:hypothetical protein